MSRATRISVLMAARDEERYLPDALDSILEQSFPHFELIVVNDGSSDRTQQVVDAARLRDPRVRPLVNPSNVGLAASLNRAFRESRGDLIARMDADDLAFPERLERQVAYLDAHPQVALLGTAIDAIDAADRRSPLPRFPAENGALQRALIRANPFAHSSVMLRRSAFALAGGYDERFVLAQDYDLWLRIAARHEVANLPEVLVLKRFDDERYSRKAEILQRAYANAARRASIERGQYPAHSRIWILRDWLAPRIPRGLRRMIRQG